MPSSFKSEVKRAKEFVQKHRVVVACGATAVVTVCVTRKFDIREVQRFAYEAGVKHGISNIDELTFLEFLDSNDLVEKYAEFFITQNVA